MKYIKVKFTGSMNQEAYQVIDDDMTTVIKYVKYDFTDLELIGNYSCNVIDNIVLTQDDLFPGSTWHDETCVIRIKLINQQNLLMLQNYPELGVYIKTNEIFSVVDSTHTYIYVNTLLPEHRYLLTMYGAEIIEKNI